MLEKIPLLGSPSKAKKLIGVIVYGLLLLIVIGALNPQQSAKETTLSTSVPTTEVKTPNGTIGMTLPDGFIIASLYINNSTTPFPTNIQAIWQLSVQSSDQELLIEGFPSSVGSYQQRIDDEIALNQKFNTPIEGRYTKTASGLDAWIGDLSNVYAMRHIAIISYGNSPNGWIEVSQYANDSSKREGMTSQAFADFVKSISFT